MTNFIIFHFQDSHHDQKQIASGLSIVVCRGFGIGEMNWMIECHLIRAGRLDVRAESSFWEGSVLCIEMASDKSVAASNILRLFTKCKIIACVIQFTLFWCILFLRQQIPICYSPKNCDPRPLSNSPWYQFRNNTVAVCTFSRISCLR